MLNVRRLSIVVIALVACGTLAGAQDVGGVAGPDAQVAPAATVAAPVPVTDAGPRIEGARVGVRSAVASAAVNAPMVPHMKQSRRGKTLMIVGGAALLGGAIIGGDAGTIVMLGGLGVGVYGLYLWVQ